MTESSRVSLCQSYKIHQKANYKIVAQIAKSLMDYGYNRNDGCFRNFFRSFVCAALSLLLGLHVYAYFWGPNQETLDGDFSDVKYVVVQLTRGLSEVSHLDNNYLFDAVLKRIFLK